MHACPLRYRGGDNACAHRGTRERRERVRAPRHEGAAFVNIEYYQEFITLAEELNFHAAADRLHISQSTLSKHIAELERHYHARLFDRDRNQVSLSSKGAVLLDCAIGIQKKYERSLQAMSQETGDSRTLFLTGILDNPTELPTMSRTLEYLKTLDEHFNTPHFLPFESANIEDQIALLESGEADCAVLNLGEDEVARLKEDDRLHCEAICQIPLDAIVRTEHRLATVEGELGVRDLFGETLIQLVGPRLSPTWKIIKGQLDAAHVPFKTRLYPAAGAYDYITLDPRDAVLLAPRSPALAVPLLNPRTVRVPVRRDELSMVMTAIWLNAAKNESLPPFIAALRQAFEDAYPDVDAVHPEK